MRCQCCNKNLNDFESTRKDTNGRFLDTCNRCLRGLGIESIGRPDLDPDEVMVEDEIFEDDEWFEEIEEYDEE